MQSKVWQSGCSRPLHPTELQRHWCCTSAGEDQVAHAISHAHPVCQSLHQRHWCCTGAGEDQVAHAGKALHGQRVRAQRNSQARHLAEAARDQRGAPIAAKAQAVADAAPDRQHILQGSPKLHACNPAQTRRACSDTCLITRGAVLRLVGDMYI